MKVSTRGRYAIRVMIDLAVHNTNDFIPLKDIATRQEISLKYLEAILKLLVEHNLVEGKRGKSGGYRLTKNPSEYTIWEIMTITECNELAPVSCLECGAPICPRKDNCPTIEMWQGWGKITKDYFSNITIGSLINKDYYI